MNAMEKTKLIHVMDVYQLNVKGFVVGDHKSWIVCPLVNIIHVPHQDREIETFQICQSEIIKKWNFNL